MPDEGRPPTPDAVVFLSIEQVDTLHEGCVRRYSPTESLAVRDPGLLGSAVMAPQHTWGGAYLYKSLAGMAAAYLVSLTQNHAYENGNKRVGFSACSTFLRLNGFRLTLTQDEAVALTLGVASHRLEREDAVAALAQAMAPL